MTEIGAQQVTTFAAADLPESFSVELKAKAGGLILGFGFGKIEVKDAPGGAVARFGFAEFEQEILRGELHDLKSLQPVQQAAELTTRIERSLATRSRLWAKT